MPMQILWQFTRHFSETVAWKILLKIPNSVYFESLKTEYTEQFSQSTSCSNGFNYDLQKYKQRNERETLIALRYNSVVGMRTWV